jgi:pyruvate/2-oxoacid:ferredoxin oxidoreductase beta subunit
MNLEFWIQILIPPIISAIVAICITFWEYRKRKEIEKKTEALKTLIDVIRGWREYIQSIANANTSLRDHIRGKTDKNEEINKFTSISDIESSVDIIGNYIHGLHTGMHKELEDIEEKLKKQ